MWTILYGFLFFIGIWTGHVHIDNLTNLGALMVGFFMLVYCDLTREIKETLLAIKTSSSKN